MSFGTTQTGRELGSYELLSKIAEGGMGAVYKARHKATRQVVAIKVIPAETAKNPVLLRRFEQEFRVAALMDHPNVVRAIEYCGAPPTPFLVMEFVDGQSLGDRVERDGPMGEEEAVGVIAQVCDGLHRAHKQGIIHRDVKPDNILLNRDGVAKLTDLGLVKDIEADDNLTRTGKGLGTPHYMAPEQFRDAKNADVRCDVYSLGATLYMLVTGTTPFAGSSPLDCWIRKSRNDFPAPQAVAPHLSDRVDFAIRRAMAAGPADRPASCREFMEDLTGVAWRPGGGTLTDTTMLAPADGSTFWYLVIRDEHGQPKTVKATTDSIRKNLQANALGDPALVLVCRSKAGPFAPLRTVPEFRDLVLDDLLAAESSASGVRLGGTSKSRLNPPSKARLAAPSKARLNDAGPPSTRRRLGPTPPPTPAARPTEPTPLPDARKSPGDVTDEVSSVPLTDLHNLHLDSAERPKLTVAPPPDRPARSVLVPLLVGAALAGVAVLAFFLVR